MSMYKVFESALAGTFDLPAMLQKIDTHHISGNLSDEERERLIVSARDKANPLAGVDTMNKLQDLEARVRALELLHAEGESTENPDGEEVVEEIIDAFVDGKWYYAGDKVTYNNKTYICIAPEDQVCVWNPDTYPAYWQIIE